MKKKAIPALALLALVLTGCASSQQPEDSAYRQITMQEAVEMMAEEENYIILDVRTESEFASGHIPGAILIPNETIGTEEILQLHDKDQLILVYCRSGNRSRQAGGQAGTIGLYQHRRVWRHQQLARRDRDRISPRGPQQNALYRNPVQGVSACQKGPPLAILPAGAFSLRPRRGWGKRRDAFSGNGFAVGRSW